MSKNSLHRHIDVVTLSYLPKCRTNLWNVVQYLILLILWANKQYH